MKSLNVCFIFIALILSSCASTKQYKSFEQGSSSSKVYIITKDYRKKSFYASKVYVGKDFLGKLGNRSYLSFTPTNSEVELLSKMENKSRLTLKIEDGKTYYVFQKLRWGWIIQPRVKLILLSEEEGKRALSKVDHPILVGQ